MTFEDMYKLFEEYFKLKYDIDTLLCFNDQINKGQVGYIDEEINKEINENEQKMKNIRDEIIDYLNYSEECREYRFQNEEDIL